MTGETCPICGRPSPLHQSVCAYVWRVICDRCGRFEIDRKTVEDLPGKTRNWNENWRTKVSHFIRGMQGDGKPPRISLERIRQFYEEHETPTPAEQGDNLVLALGDILRERPGDMADWNTDQQHEMAATIGSRNEDDILYVVSELADQGLIDDKSTKQLLSLRLTFKGWQRYDDLKSQVIESNIAFMAMPFGDDKLDRVYKECFRPAVEATGFRLIRIDEDPPTGSIINRMRVEIRRARFLLAELTGNNSGAYWEAGFAEGLGRPVIYTCEKGGDTHFDTKQLLTVYWKENNLDTAAQALKDTIRATLPVEAKQED